MVTSAAWLIAFSFIRAAWHAAVIAAGGVSWAIVEERGQLRE
jgi:hypothetical protein